MGRDSSKSNQCKHPRHCNVGDLTTPGIHFCAAQSCEYNQQSGEFVVRPAVGTQKACQCCAVC
jgi:hypothetical protein